MAHFDRGFGIEIECFLPEGQSRDALATAISQRLGRSNSCVVEAYGHSTPRSWKIVTDGSLGDYARGVEIVSPVLNGPEGIAAANTVCRTLNDFGCTVNKKCGFHVHVGVGNASLRFWKNIVTIYNIFEPVLDRMMPQSRRGSDNSYCRTMTVAPISAIERASTFDALNALIAGSSPSRYRKVNMSAYLRHGTVEFRQHSGTTDADKVRNWILICLKMVNTAVDNNFMPITSFAAQYGTTTLPRNLARVGTKNYKVGQLLLRPEGVSSQEALQATGWKSVSVPEIAGICGINFISQKQGRMTRYFAVRHVAQEISIDSFAALISLDDSERTYMQTRTNDLSGNVAWAA